MNSEREPFDPRDTHGWYIDVRSLRPVTSLGHMGSSERHFGKVDDTIRVVYTHNDFPEMVGENEGSVVLLIHRNSHARVIERIERAIDAFPNVLKEYKETGLILQSGFRYGPIQKPVENASRLRRRT